MKKVITLIAIGCLGVFGFTSTAFAGFMNFGVGPGCSPIEHVDATSLVNGDFFSGRISRNAITKQNPRGKAIADPDGDGLTNSLEECINDALIGFCSTLGGNESANISFTDDGAAPKGNQQLFTVTFDNVSTCNISECSDHVDNSDADGRIDFGGHKPNLPDLQCTDYNDNNEAP